MGCRDRAPYRDGVAAWTAPATRTSDGSPVVLKVSWPHREARGEVTGLRHWDGDGVVRVLADDGDSCAMLLERCEPGTPLGAVDLPAGDKLAVGAGILERLWSKPPTASLDLEQMSVVTAEWAGLVRERNVQLATGSLDSGLVGLGADLLESLPRTVTRTAVVHGDFNPGNVLAARREPWLAIDPKSMVGDPATTRGRCSRRSTRRLTPPIPPAS